MQFNKNTENALIAVYADSENQDIAKAISLYISDRDIKILTPSDEEMLMQAARNSVLVIIGITSKNDKNIRLAKTLQDDRYVIADIIGYCFSDASTQRMDLLGRFFDSVIDEEDVKQFEFKKFISNKTSKGTKRLHSLIREEEYNRLSDALSVSPISMIIFDADKRAVFMSDHYFRAYPKIAPRLIRGLRVYDAFDMMAAEEGISPDDEIYAKLKRFWYTLDGGIEFTLDDGISYRLKAIKLPSDRGTVIIGQNITEHMQGR